MKLVNSIIILEREELDSRVIDLVLLVKHPDGCDPIERIKAGIGEFLMTQMTGFEPSQGIPIHWSDLFHKMQGWDWSKQGLFLEEAPLWSVFDIDQYFLRSFLVSA
jgi:hypothetical protein